MALILNGGGLGDVTNFVEYDDGATLDPWLTDYTAPQSTITIGPLTIKKATPKKAAPKTTVKRSGAAGPVLDKLLPLQTDASGVKTIFGLPPAIVYVAGGILSATLLALLLRLMGGGSLRASNPKRRPTRARKRRAKWQS